MHPEGAITAMPPEDLASLRELSRLIESARDSQASLVVGERSCPLPAPLLEVLGEILRHYRNGRAVVVVPETQELTTQQAADLLGVSRPYLVRLLDEGKIPFHSVGTHRRILFADLMQYKKLRDQQRSELLSQIAREAYEAGFYNSVPDAPAEKP